MYLPTLEDAKNIVATNPNFVQRTMRGTDGTRIYDFSYSLPSNQDFQRPIPARPEIDAMELRGLTFVEYPNGDVQRYLMLRKFFSYNSNPTTQRKVLEGKTLRHISEKCDGSLARFIRVNGETRARTQKRIRAIEGDTWDDGRPLTSAPHTHAVQAIYDNDPAIKSFVDYTLDNHIAATFEYEDPEFDIVVRPDRITLVLTQMRCEHTGDILNINDYNTHGITRADSHAEHMPHTLDEIEAAMLTATHTEGWVGNFDGQLVKFKTRWYENLHDLSFEGRVTPRTLLTALMDGNLDDAIAHMGPNHAHYETARAFLEEVGPKVGRFMRDMHTFIVQHRDIVKDPVQRKALAQSIPNNKKSWLGMAVQHGNASEHIIAERIKEYCTKFNRSESNAKDFINQVKNNV